jgi:iron(III) transport system permease protein
LIFDYDAVAPVQILWGVQELTVSQRPYALASVLLLIALAAYVIVRKLIGGGEMSAASKTPTVGVRKVLPGWKGWSVSTGCLLVVLFAALPHAGVLLAGLAEPGGWYRSVIPTEWTFDHFRAALSHPLAVGSISNSLIYAIAASLLTVILGVSIGWYIARSGSRWGSAVDTLSMLPLAVPGLVLAFGYVVMTLNWPFPQFVEFLTNQGWHKLASLCQVAGQSPDPFVILVCAYTVRRIPYAVRSVVAGLQQTPRQLELAAMNLGASRLQSFFKITVPLIGAHIFAGALLTFSLTILEVSDSLILAQREVHYPVTKAIYTISHRLGDGPAIACALGIWAMLLMSLSLIGVSRLLGKRMGSMFRV